MPNRSILFATALFLVLVLGFIVSPRSSRPSTIKELTDEDYTIRIPPPEYNKPQGASVHEGLKDEDIVTLSDAQQQQALLELPAKSHVTLSSVSTSHEQWFELDFLGHETYNPNVMPHPHPLKFDQFIMVAQEVNNVTGFFTEIACSGILKNGVMKCLEEPVQLPVASSVSDKCNKKLEPFNYLVGPHDARAFYGPDRPYLLYGSPSSHTCMGMWMQDLSRLYFWDYQEKLDRHEPFFQPTDLQRPEPYAPLEKNWFPFWDRAGEIYLHYDAYPRRSFSKLTPTGGAGPDLAPQTAASDEACMAKFLPKITHPGYEHIHQSTNSLLVTLCNRTETTCFESETNTFISTILQHKMSFGGRDLYEPYVLLFKRTPPFELHAISKIPFKINGHGRTHAPAPPAAPPVNGAAKNTAAVSPTVSERDVTLSERAEEDFHYITSMNWRDRMAHYQGYLNYDLLITFGIGDKSSGAIDIKAADLFDMKNYGLCGS